MGTVTVDVKPRFPDGFPLSEGKVVLTFKGGTGFDAPWIVVHATSLDDALDTVSAENGPKLMDLMTRVQNAGQHFAGQAPAKAPGSAPAPQRGAAPAGATEPPAWMLPLKPADDWVYKTGFKNGNTWHAWAPARKGDGEWQFHRAPR